MTEISVNVDRIENVINVFGSFDENLKLIEAELGVRLTDRDSEIHISGEAENVLWAEKAVNGLITLASKGEVINATNVRYVIQLVKSGQEEKIADFAGDVICITAKGKPVKAKTLGQKKYMDAIQKNTVTLGVGPAGTG